MRSKLLIGTVAAGAALLVGTPLMAGAAGFITSADIKNSTITSKDVKNKSLKGKDIKDKSLKGADVADGSLTAADLPAQEKQVAPAFTNGGEGDCVWNNADAAIPGLGKVTYRKDMFNVTRLTGTAIASDGAGGDANCDTADPGEAEDGIAFILPASHMPAKSQLLAAGGTSAIIIVGPSGLTSGGITLPPGAVYTSGGAVILDGVTFDAAGSSVVIAKTQASGRWDGSLLNKLGLK